MELKEGEYWYFNYRDNPYIFKIINPGVITKIQGNSIAIYLKSYQNLQSASKCDDIRLATNLEKQWLNACIKANKYVECPTIEENVLNSLEIW